MRDNIKNMFYNTVGNNTARIVVDTDNGPISLYYHLNDNPVQHIWQEIHKDSSKFTMGVIHGKSAEQLVEEINEVLKRTNRSTLTLPVSQYQLNKLHNSFVEQSKINPTEDELKINSLIHAIESKNNILSDYDVTIKFYKDPNNVRIPIKEEYKLWLVNDYKWGHLRLGYGTLGKAWCDIVNSNDNIDDLNYQTDISSETLMVFNADYPFLKTSEKRLYEWAKNSGYKVPLDNLNELSLGEYLLGEIIITDTFLNFHPIISDWYVPNHYCKLAWNKEVLGYNATVKQINFFNSDMCFDTLNKHAGLESLCLK
jgi:hypothetical protein